LVVVFVKPIHESGFDLPSAKSKPDACAANRLIIRLVKHHPGEVWMTSEQSSDDGGFAAMMSELRSDASGKDLPKAKSKFES
jgi:hypothetical protein